MSCGCATWSSPRCRQPSLDMSICTVADVTTSLTDLPHSAALNKRLLSDRGRSWLPPDHRQAGDGPPAQYGKPLPLKGPPSKPDPVDPAEIVAVAVSKFGQGLGEATAKALTEVHELDHYVRAFTESSDRVRRVMLIAVVASILVFAAQRNALPGTWMKGRLEMARVAVRNRLWDHPRERLDKCLKDPKKNPAAVGVGFLNSCDEVKRLVDLISANHSEESLKADLSELERSYLSDVLWVSVPFLGIRLDVNDLGMLSSIGLVVILFTLTFAMARQNENLF